MVWLIPKVLAGLTVALVLGACAMPDPPQAGFRDKSIPLTTTTRAGQLSDIGGPWFVRGHYTGDEGITLVTFRPEGPGGAGVDILRNTCDAGGGCARINAKFVATPLGQNRWHLTGSDGSTRPDLWLIWIDDGLRTAAIGTPDGSFGWILDRAASGGQDRILAAREILDFNGYDVSALRLR